MNLDLLVPLLTALLSVVCFQGGETTFDLGRWAIVPEQRRLLHPSLKVESLDKHEVIQRYHDCFTSCVWFDAPPFQLSCNIGFCGRMEVWHDARVIAVHL